MHLKRQEISKKWPIPRKGNKYIIRPNSNINEGVPILVLLRDMLKLAQNRKEVKRAIHSKEILLNNQTVRDEKTSVLLFDRITIVSGKKNYELGLSEKGKFSINEIKAEGINKKIAKVNNKKMLKGKKIQLNLKDGRNFISNIDCKVNDSVIINLKDKKIEKCLPLKEKAKAIVFAGKHAGKMGVINKIDNKGSMIELGTKHGNLNILIKQLMVVE